MTLHATSAFSAIGNLSRMLAVCLIAYCFSAATSSSAVGQEPGVTASLGKSARPELKANSEAYFETHIASLLSRHCLDCHDSATKDGSLDLSRKSSAFAGGDSGKSLLPGSSAESLLWQLVESDEMPQNRAALSNEEKELLRRWIDAGAVWNVPVIDPEAYVHDARAAETWLQRLTLSEYIETVRSTVGVDIQDEARRYLPRDQRADGFTNTAYNLGVDLVHIEGYSRLAKTIVSRMDLAAFSAQFTDCNQLTQACMRELISRLGKQLLRGPLNENEIAAYVKVADAVSDEGGNYLEAVSYILQAMLQSPRFLYRIERQLGDGDPLIAAPYELASRLSYMLWGGPPDESLMKAAEVGDLSDSSKLKTQIQRMLRDPRAINRSLQFITEWIDLNRLETLSPNPQRFPQWNDQLARDMRDETLMFFEDLVWKQGRPLSELMNAGFTYATPQLAYHYGILDDSPSPANASENRPKVSSRVQSGLQVLYTFTENGGDVVRDVAGTGEPLDLKIETPEATTWAGRSLMVHGSSIIATAKPPKRLIDAIKKSNELTLEAWITPGNKNQDGPARIVTLSSNSSQRNFTIGQDKDLYDARLRSSGTDGNGLPSVGSASGSASTALTHLVFTKDKSGVANLYVNGDQQATRNVGPDLSKWDSGFRLALANEFTNDRPWQGVYHLVAIYSRALSAEEISAKGPGILRYELAENPTRGGLLTHGSVLTIGGDEASMVARGLFVLHDLLYSRVGNPPACVNTTPIPSKPGLSRRELAETRLADSSCVGCHARFEPLAFGLEKYDGIGAYSKADEHGNALREDGEILFPGQPKPIKYSTSAELMDLLAESERVQMAITRKVTQFALGRPLIAADMPHLQRIHTSAQANGGTYSALMTAIATSDLVTRTRTEAR